MPPKRKSGGDKSMAAKKSCVPRPNPCCPKVTSVPKLIVKGGVEVLEVVTGDDAVTQIELYLNPRMGVNNADIEHYSKWYTYSYDIGPTGDTVTVENLPSYSVARVQLPILNDDITCDTLQMWEAISVKTEVVGASSLTNAHYFDMKRFQAQGAGMTVAGVNYHMFAVGGDPLDLQGLVLDYNTKYPTGEGKPITIETITGKKMTPKNQGLDPTAKARLVKDGYFPIEVWSPDPSRNENSRYFGSLQTGDNTPTTLQFTNTLTTVLLDENGIGPLCKGDGLFVSAADIVGFLFKTSGKMAFHGLPRYFNITLRKRWVKNPYPVTNLLNSLFNNMMPNVSGQPMEGKDSQVEEVRIYQGMEPVPGDPDIVRYIDKFGQQKNKLPTLTNDLPGPNYFVLRNPAPVPHPLQPSSVVAVVSEESAGPPQPPPPPSSPVSGNLPSPPRTPHRCNARF
ncbi:major structural protein VP1 [Otomops polyomavirus KY157]|uniref:Major structural protein VP1 n=2 Tax=Alphapolyomavirus omartiensseni TaxID=1891731 RepID=L0GCI4_9POLY|nr:major structural protein VP1 [Otomops polyomavirus KY157]AGA82605.1 major structural protein VP1 [Otomops polyomavirus KY157]